MLSCKRNVPAALAPVRWLGALLLLLVAQGTIEAPVFRCIDASGVLAFQDTVCSKHVAQTEVHVRGQPLIDPGAVPDEAQARLAPEAAHSHARKHASEQTRATRHRSRQDKQRLRSYECRASDGEVFYRHSKCPASVPGDGIARFGAGQVRTGSRHGRRASRGGAWGALSVTSREIPREEACRKINAVTADGRDGHARDEQVSVYDHNLGRDPCSGY